jgi:SNF2 family DNA or RNA helicase
MARILIKFSGVPNLTTLEGSNFNSLLAAVKSCSKRSFDMTTKVWTVELNKDNLSKLSYYIQNYDYFAKVVNEQYSGIEEDKFKFLLPFQKTGVKLLIDGKVILADSVGSGKTLQAMSFASAMGYKKVLIVCPAPLKKQWQSEITKFLKEDSVILEGDYNKRLEAFENYTLKKNVFCISNYEQLISRMNDFLFKQSWDCIIFDEVHRVKNSKSKVYQAATKLFAKKKIGLSARPQENNVREIYNIANLLTNKSFMKWQYFSDNYCMYDEIYNRIKGYTMKVISAYRNLDDFHKKIEPLIIMRKRSEVLKDMPSRFYKNYYFDLNHIEKKMHNQFLLSAENAFSNDDENNLLANLTFARESCDSVKLLDVDYESSKINIMKDVLDDFSDKVVIFTQWARAAHIIVEELGADNCILVTGETVDKLAAIEEFRNSSKRFFVTTDCLNYGVNMEFVHVLVHFDLVWNPAKLEQREGRVDRLTQKENMLIINLIANNSVEERVVKMLEDKSMQAEIVMKGENAIIKKLFSR